MEGCKNKNEEFWKSRKHAVPGIRINVSLVMQHIDR